MMEDVWVLLIVLACFYSVYLWVEWVRKAGDEAIKKRNGVIDDEM